MTLNFILSHFLFTPYIFFLNYNVCFMVNIWIHLLQQLSLFLLIFIRDNFIVILFSLGLVLKSFCWTFFLLFCSHVFCTCLTLSLCGENIRAEFYDYKRRDFLTNLFYNHIARKMRGKWMDECGEIHFLKKRFNLHPYHKWL